MAIVVLVTFLSAYLAGSAFATLPGDEIPVSAALGFALWVGVVALASGAVAFALSPLVGRGASAGIAGAILVAGYFVNGYQAAVPAFAASPTSPGGAGRPTTSPWPASSTGCRSSRPRSSRSSCSSWASSCSRAATWA